MTLRTDRLSEYCVSVDGHSGQYRSRTTDGGITQTTLTTGVRWVLCVLITDIRLTTATVSADFVQCALSSVSVMRYFRFFNKCRANWARQGTRHLKLALKSLKCLFFCSSYFILLLIVIIIIIIIKPRIFYTCYVEDIPSIDKVFGQNLKGPLKFRLTEKFVS